MSNLSPEPAAARAWRRWLPPLAVFLLFLVSHVDRLYLYGDDVNNLSPGRPFPLPDYGHYIGGRVVDSFFNGFCYETFATYVAPLLGLEHVVDIHSAHATWMYALTATALAWLLCAYVRLFTRIEGWLFVPFALCLHVYVLGRIEMDAVTGISAYLVPLALGLALLLPFVRLAVLGEDMLAGRSRWARTAGISLLTYLVSFSLTNVELFTALALAACIVTVVVSRARAAGKGAAPRALWAEFRGLPGWTRLVALLMPLLVLVAVYFDMTSGRFQDEQQQTFGAGEFRGLSLLGGLRSLPLRAGPVLDTIALLALGGGAVALALGARRPGGAETSRRLSRLALVFVPASLLYALFLLRVSHLGGKDYFAKDGLNSCLVIALMLPIVGALFGLARTRAGAIPAGFLVFVVSFTGLRQLEQTPVREVTKAETKGVFDSLYMSYVYGEPRVPIVLRHGGLGWPNAPDGEGWYLDTFWRVFREQVIGHGGALEPGYQPRFELVRTVDELYEHLAAMQRTRPLLRLGAEQSPYWIDVPARDARRSAD